MVGSDDTTGKEKHGERCDGANFQHHVFLYWSPGLAAEGIFETFAGDRFTHAGYRSSLRNNSLT